MRKFIKGGKAHTADLAHRDLVRFLTSRAREVRPNGIFVAGLSCGGDRDVEISSLDRPGSPVSAFLAREQLIAEGWLPKEIATVVVVAIHARTREEMEAALEVVKEFWEVEEMVVHEAVHPAYGQPQAELKAGRGGRSILGVFEKGLHMAARRLWYAHDKGENVDG